MRPEKEKSGLPSLIFAILKNHRVVPAGGGQAVDDRPPGIAETEQFRDLVVGLARRIVPGAGQKLVSPQLPHEKQAGVTA